MKRRLFLLTAGLICSSLFFSCTSTQNVKGANKMNEKNPSANFESINYATSLKSKDNGNPIMTQRFSADPWAMEYDGTLYVYMTNDILEKNSDGTVKENSYSKVNTLNVLSTKDLVNWTDCGSIKVAGSTGAAKWCNQSWAPAAAHKTIDGKEKFFLYFAAGGNGVGVLTSDCPTGPFTDPLGHALISRSVPTCAEVTWLFDPAVLIDDDGKGYIYFGGGIPGNNSDSAEVKAEHEAHPRTIRAVQLGDDMISIVGTPVVIDAPYSFEDSGINKFNGKYYYSYCVNWNVTPKAKSELNISSAHIAYMTSDSPLGPFKLQKSFLKNPGEYFGTFGNNHHCIFSFKNKNYIAYHAFLLQDAMCVKGGYRSTNINEITISGDGTIDLVKATRKGVDVLQSLNPYDTQQAETIACMGEITTVPASKTSKYFGSGNMAVSNTKTGAWIEVRSVDFGNDGASYFTANVLNNSSSSAIMQIKIDSLEEGNVLGYCVVPSTSEELFSEVKCVLENKPSGVHNLYFIFAGSNFEFDSWKFSK